MIGEAFPFRVQANDHVRRSTRLGASWLAENTGCSSRHSCRAYSVSSSEVASGSKLDWPLGHDFTARGGTRGVIASEYKGGRV